MESYKRIAKVKSFLNAIPVVERCALRNQVQNSKWIDFLLHELREPTGGGLCIETEMWRFWIKDEKYLNELLVQLV